LVFLFIKLRGVTQCLNKGNEGLKKVDYLKDCLHCTWIFFSNFMCFQWSLRFILQ